MHNKQRMMWIVAFSVIFLLSQIQVNQGITWLGLPVFVFYLALLQIVLALGIWGFSKKYWDKRIGEQNGD